MKTKKWWQMGGGLWGDHLLELGAALRDLWLLIKRRKT